MSRYFDREAAVCPRGAVLLLAGCAVLFTAQRASAQDLSLQSVVKLALTRNERAEIAAQNVVSADAAVSKARAERRASAQRRSLPAWRERRRTINSRLPPRLRSIR